MSFFSFSEHFLSSFFLKNSAVGGVHFSLMPFFLFSCCRAAERPSGSDRVSGKRGCGPGEKAPPAVAAAGLLLQLGLP